MLGAGLCLILIAAPGSAPPDPPKTPAERLDEAKKAAWQIVGIVLPKLSDGKDPASDPGLRAFAGAVARARDAGAEKAPKGKAPVIDVEALVTRNPAFWRAQYEVAPGDPGWLLLHGALLLAGGEATRAQAVLILARQRGDLPAPIRIAVNHLIGHAGRILKDGNDAVQAGIEPYDRGDLDGALKIYRGAVAAWPANGWAHFEIGLTLMSQEAKRLNVDVPKGVSGQKAGGPEIHTEDALAAFAESRRHDPFPANAYRGKFEEVKPRLLALAQKVIPTWQILLGGKSPSDAQLLAFSEGLQEAGADDLALVARQLVVSRRGRFAPADHPFIAASLRRLAPGAEVDPILDRLAGDKMQVRQIVKPEPARIKP